jgi:hypothetical protein
LFDTGHFALEEDLDGIGPLIHDFLDWRWQPTSARSRDSDRRQSSSDTTMRRGAVRLKARCPWRVDVNGDRISSLIVIEAAR